MKENSCIVRMTKFGIMATLLALGIFGIVVGKERDNIGAMGFGGLCLTLFGAFALGALCKAIAGKFSPSSLDVDFQRDVPSVLSSSDNVPEHVALQKRSI